MSTTETAKDSYEEQLRQLFISCDGEQCGFLDRTQLYELTDKLQLDEQQTNYIVDNLICDQFSKVNFDEFKEVFVSLLTQSQLFNTSANNYSNLDNLEKDQFNRTQSNLSTVVEQHMNSTTTANNNQMKMNTYHQLDNDEPNTNRKQNGRTNQTNRRCKKSKKSTNNTIKFDSSFDKQFDKPFKENDDNQENSTKHLNVQKNKQMTNLNMTKSINLDKDHRKQQQNLNDRLNGQSNKKMRNSSSGAEEGYSSLDDCGSTSSQSSCTIAESPDLVSNDEDKNDKLSSLHSYSHHLNLNNSEKNLDLNSDESSDHSTVSSTTELNKTTTTDDFNQDELDQQRQLENIEQSTEQYLSSIWSELNVGKEGYLTLNELFIICQHTMGKIDEELVKQLFDRLDEDKDGKVSFDELLKQLSSNLTNDLTTNTSGLNDKLNDYTDNDKVLNENSQSMNTEFNRECNINYNTTNPNSNSRRSSLNLELSPYTTTTYKNYFSPSSENELNFKDSVDNVDNVNESFFSSLDSNLVQKSSAKHQRTNSFTANADCLLENMPSSSTNTSTNKQTTLNTNQQQQQQDLKHQQQQQQQNQASTNSLSSFTCCCSNQSCLTNNNQSKSDYEFISNGKVFGHKHTNSVGQTLNQQHCKNCIQNNCNKLLNSSSLTNSSSVNSSSSTMNPSSIETNVNQTLSSSKNLNSNLSSIDEQSLPVEIASSLNSSLNASLNEQTKLRNKCLKTSKEDQSAGQGDIYCKKRNSITDKFNGNVTSNLSSRFSSTNVSSTPETEHTQLLNSMHHQFNSSHLYHHQSTLNKDHLSQEPELNEDDFCNLTGLGNLLSVDPFGYG